MRIQNLSGEDYVEVEKCVTNGIFFFWSLMAIRDYAHVVGIRPAQAAPVRPLLYAKPFHIGKVLVCVKVQYKITD